MINSQMFLKFSQNLIITESQIFLWYICRRTFDLNNVKPINSIVYYITQLWDKLKIESKFIFCLEETLSFKVLNLITLSLIKLIWDVIYIFNSDLVWRRQLLKVKDSCCMCKEFLTFPNLSWIYFVFQKSLKRMFKTGFLEQNHLLNLCSSAMNSKGYCVVKKLLWNVRIKAFWYTNLIMQKRNFQQPIKKKYFLGRSIFICFKNGMLV